MVDTSDDRRIDLAEFQRAIPLLATWSAPVADAAAEFAAIDVDGGGSVLFDEFCGWALKRGLDMDTSDSASGEADLRGQHKLASEVAAQDAKDAADRRRQLAEDLGGREFGAGDMTTGLDLRAVLAKLPCDERAPEEQDEKVREKLFSSWDINGNGFLTLTEIHRGLLSLLGALGGSAVAALQPAIARAFHAARDSRTVGKASEYVAQG